MKKRRTEAYSDDCAATFFKALMRSRRRPAEKIVVASRGALASTIVLRLQAKAELSNAYDAATDHSPTIGTA